MALDVRLPLEVLRPDQVAQTSLKTNLMSQQGKLGANEVAQISVDNQLKQLEVAKRQADVTVQLLSGATDQNTWLANKQKAASLGLDVSNVPDQYDPQIKNQLMMSTLSIKDRLDLQLNEAQNTMKAEERLYDRSKDERQFGLEERKVRAAENENLILPMGEPTGINPNADLGPAYNLNNLARPPLLPASSSLNNLETMATIPPQPVMTAENMALDNDILSAIQGTPAGQAMPTVQAEALLNINDPVAPLNEVPFASKKGAYITTDLPEGYALKMDGTAALIPGVKQKEKALSATEQKEVFDATDIITNSEGAKGALVAAKNLLDSKDPEQVPFSGTGADMRTSLARTPLVGDLISDKSRGAATTDYNTLIKEQALSSLKATFGGNPTEGERQILLSLQAISTYTPEEQKKILDRAIKAADRKINFTKSKVKSIVGRDYEALSNSAAPTAPDSPDLTVTPSSGVKFLGFE